MMNIVKLIKHQIAFFFVKSESDNSIMLSDRMAVMVVYSFPIHMVIESEGSRI